ncbi:sensor histidine kinase [Amycolatopsis sp. GM8]|uniref:sensor histidine kinase n=1 Tax=Amycolatopsis sp. GM8 TaxID=2896530 RepID=UPI001F47E8D3|nr:sensor histidine kinase [Amycolatopsis sp. GM8]
MNAWQRYYWLWQVVFGADLVVTVALVLAEGGETRWKLVSVGAIVAIALVYTFVARSDLEGRGAAVFAGVLVVLTVIAILADPAAGFALFSVCPMLFMATPLPVAVPATVIVILTPVLSVLLHSGLHDPSLNTLLPMTALLAVFSVCVGLWFEKVLRQSRERADLINQLEASRAEVARLSHEAGTSAERERLAREIHDTLAQGFTSIVTLLQAVESEWDDEAAVRRHVDLAARTARENLTEARAMVAALTPSALTAGTLEDAVRRQAERFAEETGIAVTCDVGPLPVLRTVTEVVLLRATQEALTNVRKHARASAVSIELSAVDSCVRLTVRDDGRGFDPAAATEGFGLTGMRARAEQVGGRLSVHCGQGAAVAVEVPA